MSDVTRQRALCHQVVSNLLDYPTDELRTRLPMIRAAIAELPPLWADMLMPLVERLETEPMTALQADYVATFDLRRKCCLYLTYYAHGDTRKRGSALLAFKQAYRRGGVELGDSELPDHLAVVLEFAATVDPEAGRQLLIDHRAGLQLLELSLGEMGSPYVGAVKAVSATLPKIRGDVHEIVRRLIAEGPPDEGVGLEPFAPPTAMGVRP
jgi:nitrate reductase delta subunit